MGWGKALLIGGGVAGVAGLVGWALGREDSAPPQPAASPPQRPAVPRSVARLAPVVPPPPHRISEAVLEQYAARARAMTPPAPPPRSEPAPPAEATPDPVPAPTETAAAPAPGPKEAATPAAAGAGAEDPLVAEITHRLIEKMVPFTLVKFEDGKIVIKTPQPGVAGGVLPAVVRDIPIVIEEG